MPFLRRREKPLHAQLAEGTGLLEWRSKHAPVYPIRSGHFGRLHGGKPRRWGRSNREAPGLSGDALEFAALPDATLLVEDDLPADALAPLAEVVEQSISAPYRARAVRSEGDLWAVAANAIQVVELAEEITGDTISLAVQDGERTLVVDERPAWRHPAWSNTGRVTPTFVLIAERLDGKLWSVEVNPL